MPLKAGLVPPAIPFAELYRLIAPGSEWRLHRHWFDQSALADLLGGDFGLAEIHRLYECHDKLLEHKKALFEHLTERWRMLFAAKYEVLAWNTADNSILGEFLQKIQSQDGKTELLEFPLSARMGEGPNQHCALIGPVGFAIGIMK